MWVIVGNELLVVFFEIEHFVGVRRTCKIWAGQSMAILVFLVMLSKLVCFFAVRWENFELINDIEIGNLSSDK